MTRERAWRTELDPTPTQATEFRRAAGCVRWVWNHALADRQRAWEERKETIRAKGQNPSITAWKREEAPWLSEVPLCCLQETLIHLDSAFSAFWRRANAGETPGYPRFKSRYGDRSFTLRGNVTIGDSRITVPWALGRPLGTLKLKERGYLPVGRYTPRTQNWDGDVRVQRVTISEEAGRWFVSVQGYERVAEPTAGATDSVLGVHLGVRVLATCSDGRRFENPEHLASLLRKVARFSRVVSRRKPKPGVKGSNRYADAKARLAKLHYRIACARLTALHQVSHEIIADATPRPAVVVLDGWDVADMLETSPTTELARRMADTGMGELRRQLRYKAEWAGIEVMETEPGTAITRTCAECGWVRPTELTGHVFRCGSCGYEAEREGNSARGLVKYAAAKRAEAQNAQGGDAA